jgi:drug/metabolite transporter superfamily protein YnfA
MLLLTLLLYPTPIAAGWLIINKMRAKPMLPFGLLGLLLLAVAGWIVTTGVLVHDFGHFYHDSFGAGLEPLADAYESTQGLLLP